LIVKSKPVVKTFKLACDPEGSSSVTIFQSTFGGDMQRADIYTKQRTILPINEGERPIIEENRNRARSMAWEIMTVLSAVAGFVDEQGNDLQPFKFKEGKNGIMKIDMTEQDFMEALGQLTSEAVEEIHDHVLEVNPTWGTPRKKKEAAAEAGKKDDPLGESKTTSG
jgi:hypothetical protein